MEHLLLKAATTATDQGTFEAVISAGTMDRERDVVEPQAMVDALKKWAELGKLVPLAYNHTDEVIGHIDPASAHVQDREVVAKGFIDQSVPRGEEMWRLVKSGTLSFSFGFLIPKGGATKLDGGRLHIKELDVFEVSAVPIAPANNDTRVLSWKSAAEKVFDEHELEAAVKGELKAVWTTAYINDLPDSCFLYIEPGGEKDSEGKTTPRSLRHFPVKDASGSVDMPHLRNALSRIPQSNLPQSVKDRLAAMAQRMLDNTKSADLQGEPAAEVRQAERRPADPLRNKVERTRLDVLMAGVPRSQSPIAAADEELVRQAREEMLQLLNG